MSENTDAGVQQPEDPEIQEDGTAERPMNRQERRALAAGKKTGGKASFNPSASNNQNTHGHSGRGAAFGQVRLPPRSGSK